MLAFFLEMIQEALDELELEPSEVYSVEIAPHPGESCWLNFDDDYYACVQVAHGKMNVWLAGMYPLPEEVW